MKKSNSSSSSSSTATGAFVAATEKEEKERKKKEKRDKKEKDRKGNMSAEDLLRLDEVRRSLKFRGKRKEREKLPSGITADYSAQFFGDLERENLTEIDASSSSYTSSSLTSADGSSNNRNDTTVDVVSDCSRIGPPRKEAIVVPVRPLPPRPPKRGILKQYNQRHSIAGGYVEDGGYYDSMLLSKSALLKTHDGNVDYVVDHAAVNELNPFNSTDFNYLPPTVYAAGHHDNNSGTKIIINNHHHHQSYNKSSVESLTDSTTNSSFATPPFSSSPVGEGQGFYSRFSSILLNSSPEELLTDFPLPDVEPVILPAPRILTISRRVGSSSSSSGTRNDFGFSLRRAMTVDRLNLCQFRTVILAEIGLGEEPHQIGILPGDRLLEVNGVSVEDKTREEIIEVIKMSDQSVEIKVQPISELSELSRRYHIDGSSIELDDSNIRCGTLKRSGSKRFKQSDVSHTFVI